jgi:hypothetical protein
MDGADPIVVSGTDRADQKTTVCTGGGGPGRHQRGPVQFDEYTGHRLETFAKHLPGHRSFE